MEQRELLQILQDWNFWTVEQDIGVPRPEYVASLRRLLETNQILTVTGPRRAGKSVLMRQAAKTLIDEGVKPANILFVNFEDPRFTTLTVQFLTRLYEAYRAALTPHGPVIVLLDEVQAVAGWERWVRMMHELRKAKLIVSGSNAQLLSQELGTLLTGRHLDVTVFPLSFREFLAFRQCAVPEVGEGTPGPLAIHEAMRDYLEFGGFPEVALSTHKKQTLLAYGEDVLTKDLLRRFRIRKPDVLKSLVNYYLTNVASPITFHALERFLHVDAGTIEKFSGYLEQVYLTFFLKRFAFSVKEQDRSPRKVYAIDPGLSHAMGFRFSENIGRAAEQAVFLELKRRQALSREQELYYWKDPQHREVDMVVKAGLQVTVLIQVCWNVEALHTKDRELRSLLKAMQELKQQESWVITHDYEATESFEDRTVRFVPLWKWLLRTSE